MVRNQQTRRILRFPLQRPLYAQMGLRRRRHNRIHPRENRKTQHPRLVTNPQRSSRNPSDPARQRQNLGIPRASPRLQPRQNLRLQPNTLITRHQIRQQTRSILPLPPPRIRQQTRKSRSPTGSKDAPRRLDNQRNRKHLQPRPTPARQSNQRNRQKPRHRLRNNRMERLHVTTTNITSSQPVRAAFLPPP